MNWSSYPRPQLRRDNYILLNGEWKLDGRSIKVPFPPQSKLSGYEGEIKDNFEYVREFEIPVKEGRWLLHFGAVDQCVEVYVDDMPAGSHKGGYLPFFLDITDKVRSERENSEISKNKSHKVRLCVKDDLSNIYPYGKQKNKRGGMWYTPVSGIWQTVWLENVPKSYIKDIVITPDLNGINVDVVTEGDKENIGEISVEIKFGNESIGVYSFDGTSFRIDIDEPKHWTVDNPNLYDIKIKYGEDSVYSYFALRTIRIKQINGINRVCLNEKEIFLHGVLDQGYFSDGIYLPANEEEYENDIKRMKELGFNMLRKHIKIEPEAFYYACDRLGMLVMQDMVNNGRYSFLSHTALPTIGFKKRKDYAKKRDEKCHEFFINHTKQTIRHLYNHPSIIAYTVFNEGWGQFESDKLYEMVKQMDKTRLVDATSGWFWQEKSDFDSEHIYFKIKRLQPKSRPLIVSECGGYTLEIKGHIFNEKNKYGYGKCQNKEELTTFIENMYEKMIIPAIEKGVCGCIYTQLSDVEDEINGLYTYDRKECKVVKARIKELAKKIKKIEKKY